MTRTHTHTLPDDPRQHDLDWHQRNANECDLLRGKPRLYQLQARHTVCRRKGNLVHMREHMISKEGGARGRIRGELENLVPHGYYLKHSRELSQVIYPRSNRSSYTAPSSEQLISRTVSPVLFII